MQNRKDSLSELPEELFDHAVSFLTAKELVTLGSVKKTIYAELKESNTWQLKEPLGLIKTMGVKPKILQEIQDMAAIYSYKNLYEKLCYIKQWADEIHFSWELILISGELSAINYAIEKELISNKTHNRSGENPLYLASFSGSVDAMKLVMEKLDIDPNELTGAVKRSLFHAAAWSGSYDAIEYLHFLHSAGILQHDHKTEDDHGNEPATYVDWHVKELSLNAKCKQALLDPGLKKDEYKLPEEKKLHLEP